MRAVLRLIDQFANLTPSNCLSSLRSNAERARGQDEAPELTRRQAAEFTLKSVEAVGTGGLMAFRADLVCVHPRLRPNFLSALSGRRRARANVHRSTRFPEETWDPRVWLREKKNERASFAHAGYFGGDRA